MFWGSKFGDVSAMFSASTVFGLVEDCCMWVVATGLLPGSVASAVSPKLTVWAQDRGVTKKESALGGLVVF